MNPALLALLLACKPEAAPAADDTGAPGGLELPLDHGSLWLSAEGWAEVRDAEGRPVVQRAVGVAMLDAADGSGRVLRTDADRVRALTAETGTDGAVEGLWLHVEGGAAEPDLDWRFTRIDGDAVSVVLEVDNASGQDVEVAKLAPLRADSAWGGGLFVGQRPERHRILENGSHAALDFIVEVRPGDTPPDAAAAAIAPGEYAGASVSNWNHAVGDLDSDAVWVAGALSYDRSMPVINLTGHATAGPVDESGRRGFSYLSLEADYLPSPKGVPAGERLASETYALLPFEATVQDGLEHYATLVAAHLGLVPWHRRAPGRRVPNGWNSWSGSGSTGGYGTDIDEALVLANAEWMARELRDWGMTWFQVDDGYEPTYGDWTWDEDRFPSGARGLSDAIRDLGFTPGLWMAPFTAYDDSELVAQHPDWFADKTALGIIVSGDYQILDLTNPEVQAWLAELARTVHEDWGYDWYKMDFSYYAMFGQDLYDPTATREEAWRTGLAIMREHLGEDTFYLMVGLIGLTYDRADSARLTLDNAPVWDWDPSLSMDDHMDQQGFKPTVRTAGRRWYLQDRVWVNHPDLIIFRSNTDNESWPRVTATEARSFATWVGLSGGIVKLGDRLLELEGSSVDVIRRLLPIYGSAARPVDVLEREFPEVWHLQVQEPLDGLDEAYDVVGLFHWGLNLDLTTEPSTVIADSDEPRVHVVALDELGVQGPVLAWEFWTESFLGVVQDALEVSVPSHDSRVVALRPVTGEPQLLGWNRQVTMGGVLLEAADWDAARGVFTLRFPVVPGTELAPFSWRIAVYLPEGTTLEGVQAQGAEVLDLQATVDGSVVTVSFDAAEAGDLELELAVGGG